MNDPQRKLTVRVKLAPEAMQDAPETPRYSYRWDRIALAGLVLAVLVALAFRALLTPDPAPAVGVDAADPGATPIAGSPPEPARRVESQPSAATQTAGPPPSAPAEPQPVAQRDTASAERPAAAPPAEIPAAEPAAAEPAVTAAPEPPAATAVADPRVTAGGDGAAGTAAGAVPAPAPRPARDAALVAGPTRVLSDHVSRFVLTDDVRNREPVGDVSDIRARPPGGPVAVFAFSDVRGLSGETLYYRWIRAGKVTAEVKVRVGSNRWRSYSSKFINASMRGPWRVELRNGAGDLLAEAAFEY